MTDLSEAPERSSTTKPLRPRRSFLPRFGLRSLLIVGLLACPLFAWVGSNLHRARQEDAAIEMLWRSGAAIYLHGDESYYPAGPKDIKKRDDRWQAADFFDRAIGRSHRPKVRAIMFDDRRAPHPTIRAAVDGLRHLPEIEQAEFAGAFFDDATCDGLSQLPKLEALSLYGTSVAERGLSRLESLPQLQTITIGNSTSTNAVAALPRLKRLRTIALFDVYVTPESVAGIATLPELETLELSFVASKNEEAFQPLSSATTLRTLTIMGGSFDEEDLPALAGLRNLERLCIRVQDDDSLAHFAGLSKLRRLDLYGGATPDGVRRFSAEMPELLIRVRIDDETSESFLNGEPVEDKTFDDVLTIADF